MTDVGTYLFRCNICSAAKKRICRFLYYHIFLTPNGFRSLDKVNTKHILLNHVLINETLTMISYHNSTLLWRNFEAGEFFFAFIILFQGAIFNRNGNRIYRICSNYHCCQFRHCILLHKYTPGQKKWAKPKMAKY